MWSEWGWIHLLLVCWSTIAVIQVVHTHATPVYGYEGSPAWLLCPLPRPSNWYRLSHSGDEVHVVPAADGHIQSLPNNTLYIPHVELTTEAVYLCVTGIGQNATVELRVRVTPHRLSVSGIPQQIKAGDTLTLPCSVDRIRPLPTDIYWQFTDSDGMTLRGRKQTTLLDPVYQVYSVSSTIAYTISSADLMRNLKCVLKTADNQFLRKYVALSPCYGNFTKIPHTASLGGSLAPERYNTESLCRQFCQATNSCSAFDFNTCNRKCYINGADYLEHIVPHIIGIHQYRRTDCSQYVGPNVEGGYTEPLDILQGNSPSTMSVLSLTVEKTTLAEGEILQARCKASPSPPPEALFLQFEDQPLDILLTETRRIIPNQLPQLGLRVIASLNYIVTRADDGRALRCVLISGENVVVSASRTLRICYDGYSHLETSRSPGGFVYLSDVTHGDVCQRICEEDGSCTATEFDFCNQKCYKHTLASQHSLDQGLYEVDLYRKSTCAPSEHAAAAKNTHGNNADSDTAKFLAFVAICIIMIVIVIVLAILAIHWYRKYKYTAPKKVAEHGSGTSIYQGVRMRHHSSKSKRLSMYADPLKRYSSGFMSHPPGTLDADTNLHNNNRHSAVF